MKKIKGLYIEDELANIKTYTKFFELAGFEIIYLENLLDSPEKYYDFICENNVDFIIIDNHLDKQAVNYDGFKILQEIRKQDPNIYILLLTNFEYESKDNLGDLDQTVNKEDFVKKFSEITERIKRAHLRRISMNAAEDIKDVLDLKIKESNKQLVELDRISKNLEKLVTTDCTEN